jgi:hypothetical protein
MQHKSPLFQKISDWADSKYLRINDVESFARNLDNDFELQTEDGKEFIVRKQTGQVVSASVDETFIKTVLRPHINDKSFGTFRSAFPARATTNDEKSKVVALLESVPTVFTNDEKKTKLQSFLMNNFVPSGNRLHRLVDGHVSSQSWSPDQLIQHYAQQYIDPDKTTYERLKKEAILREEAKYLSTNDKDFNRINDLLQRINETKFEEVPTDLFQKQEQDLRKKAMAHIGLIDEKAATLAELNQVGVKVKAFKTYIDSLPVVTDL